MAAKPIERYVKKQIADQGGWDRILERIASGETVAHIATTILRPDGRPISRAFLSFLAHHDPERSQRIKDARLEAAHALADHAVEVVRSSPLDRDSIQKARVVADVDLRLAGLWNRPDYGESKQAVSVTVNHVDLHLDSLRHRESAVGLAVHAGNGNAVQACETNTSQNDTGISGEVLQIAPPPQK